MTYRMVYTGHLLVPLFQQGKAVIERGLVACQEAKAFFRKRLAVLASRVLLK